MSLNHSEIDWSPASSFGANFCTHKLSKDTSGRLEFKPTLGMKLFYLAFCFMTCAVSLAFLAGYLAGEVPLTALFFVFVVTGVFAYICRMLKKMVYASNYFDRLNGIYFAVEPAIFGAEKEIREAISAIEALQILPKQIHSSNNPYTTYELNLMMHCGKRHTVISHSSYDDIKQDAQTISTHLGIIIVEKE